jgi:splicing factor 3A subunit 3
MYAKQTVFDAHLQSKKHLKAAAREGNKAPNGQSAHSAPSARPQSKLYGAARLTALIQPLLVSLLPVLAETKNDVERRFSLTARERELELQAAAAPPQPSATPVNGAVAEEEEEEEKIYNPLKLPLGWDGKPIPYWLYKLHGLGVEYRCEICSDGVYMGRLVQSRTICNRSTD